MGFGIAAMGWLLASSAWAQVNAENFASRATSEGWGLSLGLGHTSATGNVDLFDLKEEGAFQVLRAFDEAPNEELWFRDRLLLTFRGAHKAANGEPILNESLAHLRLTHNLVPRFGVETFGQLGNDRVLLLEWRYLAGAGVRATAFLTERGGLWGGTGYMAEQEVRNVPPGGPDAARVLNHRSTTYVAWRWSLVPGAVFWANTAYIQPRLDDLGDVQLVDESELVLTVTKALSVKTALRVRQDTRPPADLAPWDVRVTNTLQLAVGGPPKEAVED